ncbi:MAG TPA: sugar transferase [Candidatus Baltobacteraceae bacterium]|jgi:lipopolysaccharide/colanic/teichoic acid biosynthesis glycosyltransferase|nr:sugar transferase [Candidatus Baltobacteraceae bacterium]
MRRAEEATKRALDILASFVGLLLLWPAFLVISVLIRLDSKGPAFYKSLRVGRHGAPFAMWKFRTMRLNSENDGITTGKDDPRVTRVGRFLRRYKIDELPQLTNVLSGDMSLVGPRPDFEEHTSAYREDEKVILSVRPGITDYASLHFHNLSDAVGSKDPHRVYVDQIRPQKNRLRVAYVRRQSLGEDCRILFWTLVRVVWKH